METLEIKKEAVSMAHKNASDKGKKITERIKTVDDVLRDNNITQKELDMMFANIPEHFKYQYIAELISKSLNQGYTPDWDNLNEYKYFPWFKMSSSGFRYCNYDDWSSGSNVSSRLCFRSPRLATYAGEQFIEVYKKFMVIE